MPFKKIKIKYSLSFSMQMEKVEADLSRSKSLREKQSKEFSWQLEELKQRYEQQVSGFVLGRLFMQLQVSSHILILFSLCLPPLCVKAKCIGVQSLCDGKSLHRKCCFLFAILCTSGSYTFFPRLTGGNTYFCNSHMNVLSVFVTVKKQPFILFFITF